MQNKKAAQEAFTQQLIKQGISPAAAAAAAQVLASDDPDRDRSAVEQAIVDKAFAQILQSRQASN